jgi:RNA recognition motif-containing protein
MELYIGGIPWESTEQEIENLFKKFGTVSKVSLPRDRFSDRILGLDKFELHGRPLHVNKALNPRKRLF